MRHRAALQVPAGWIGRRIFKIPEAAIQGVLPMTNYDEIPQDGRVNIDLLGWYQYDRALSFYTREQARQWLRFQDRWLDRLSRKPRPFYVCAHLRRGDLFQHADRWCIVSRESYERAIVRFGYSLDDVIWISEETQQPDPELDAEGLGMLTDFFTLINADVIFRANSSFSWWGATLGRGKVYSPLVEDRVGPQDVEFVEGNWARMIDMKHQFGMCIHSDLHLRER
jgi:hypothetical protein